MREIERRAGMPENTLRHILSGKVQNPRADTLLKLSEALGCDLVWLITGEGTATRIPNAERKLIFRIIREMLATMRDAPVTIPADVSNAELDLLAKAMTDGALTNFTTSDDNPAGLGASLNDGMEAIQDLHELRGKDIY